MNNLDNNTLFLLWHWHCMIRIPHSRSALHVYYLISDCVLREVR